MSLSEAWDLYDRILSDPRVTLVQEKSKSRKMSRCTGGSNGQQSGGGERRGRIDLSAGIVHPVIY